MDHHMKRIIALALLALPLLVSAQVYNKFGPAAGVLKGSTATYQTTAAASSDILGLWSGTCNSSTFLRGDGACATAGGGGGTPAGSDTQIQYNASGSFGASANFFFDRTNNVLHLNTNPAQGGSVFTMTAGAGGGVTMVLDDSAFYGLYYKIASTGGIFNIGASNSTGGSLGSGLEIVNNGSSVLSATLKAAGSHVLGLSSTGAIDVNNTNGTAGQVLTSGGSGAAAWADAALSATSVSIGGSPLIAGACATAVATVTGATTSMAVISTPATYPGDGTVWMAYVDSPDSVTVKVCAIIAVTPTSSTYNIRVMQ